MLTPLPTMLGTYRHRYPRVQLLLSESYTASIAASLARGTLDAGFLRDGGPIEGLHVESIFSEPYVAVLPSRHRLAGKSTISPADLRDEPFVFFTPTAGKLAYDKTMLLFEEYGFRPQVVQEAPQWLTILRLVAAGLGVSVGPACTRQIAVPGLVCPSLRGAAVTSDLELAYRETEDRAVVAAFAAVARKSFGNADRPSRGTSSRRRASR
jgi:DNA-binding transcriptional LysR family regulator